MPRMACVDLPAFPLQLLLQRHPDWRELPAVVVDEDRPQGLLLWVNERARAQRILPGMRYAAALSLARELRAGVVSATEIDTELEALSKRLHFFSPEVERAREDPGSFWLGAEGLGLLHPEFPGWAELIRSDLRQAGYVASVAVGFSRFGCHAAARAGVHVVVFEDPDREKTAVRRIPIDRVTGHADFRDTLAKLGIFELGGFLDLPPSGIRRRFGEAAFALHRMARGDAWAPLAPEIPEEPHERRVILDHGETNAARLLQALEEDIAALLGRLGERDRALSGLAVELTFDYAGPDGPKRRIESVRPATPTRDVNLLLDLLRLRLESMTFPSGVTDVRLEAEFTGASREQMTLFPEQHRRDLAAANRALARVRAEFGAEAVCAARLVDAHLPEARIAWDPLGRLAAPEPRTVRQAPVVRRILRKPEEISLYWPPVAAGAGGPGRAAAGDRGPDRAAAGGRSPDRDEAASRTSDRATTASGRAEVGAPRGMTLRGAGIIAEAAGPFVVSGGWWKREVVRHYWYVRIEPWTSPRDVSPPGDTWSWIYRDARRRKWYRQGGVE